MPQFTPNPARPADSYQWPPACDAAVVAAVAEEAEQQLFVSYGYNAEDLDLEPLAAAMLCQMGADAETPEATAAAYGDSHEASSLRHSMALRISNAVAAMVPGVDLPPLVWHGVASVESVGYTLHVHQGLVPHGTTGPVVWRLGGTGCYSYHRSLAMALHAASVQVALDLEEQA